MKFRSVTAHKPLISIGMPVYNGEPFLKEALDSILGQTFEDFEVIISDNASTDRTQDVCREYAAKDQRIRYYRNRTNLGAAINYNRVFELSRGEYFKWAAADDLCAPEFLEKCSAVLNQFPEVILCYPLTDIIDEHGNLVRPYEKSLNLRSPSIADRFHQAIMSIGECNAIFGLIRSKVLQNTSLIGRYPGSDRVLLTELALYGQFFELGEHLFFRREHARASSCNRSIENTQEFFDPKTKGKVCMFRWKHEFQHFANVVRAPITGDLKLRLCFVILQRGVYMRRLLAGELWSGLKQISRRIATI